MTLLACDNCFYKKVSCGPGWFCYMFKHRQDPPRPCFLFRDHPISTEDNRLAMDDPFWESAIRSAHGLG